MLNKPFSIVAREWEDKEDSVAEDSVWDYAVYKISVDDVVDALSKDKRVSVEVTEEGIKIKDNVSSHKYFGSKEMPSYYCLSGRMPDWRDDKNILQAEAVKKKTEITTERGDVERFNTPKYADYATFGLFKPDNTPLMNNEMVYCMSIVSILSTLQHEKIDMNKVSWGEEREGLR